MAEREGFEPSKPFWGLRDFESRAFDHSATSPWDAILRDGQYGGNMKVNPV
jgi:hypothetical protein